jgi:hypothetical protein
MRYGRPLNTDGLIKLLSALRSRCECEIQSPHEECEVAQLNRWWVAHITGSERAA